VRENETDLVAAARDHAPAAWDALLKRHQLPLYTYAAKLLQDDTAALDVVQETFVAAVRHIGSLRDDTRFSSWLFGIAHQRCIQWWRLHVLEDFSLQEIATIAGVPVGTVKSRLFHARRALRQIWEDQT
jgi:RNA polymerase sigma-70 factor (ECF subfamily)